MPLNLSTSEGEFVPYLKYNAKAGRWYVRPKDAQRDVEVVSPRLAFDFASIKTGWLYYAEGSGPEKVWDPSLTQAAQKPPGPKKFKRGFEVLVYGGDDIPGVGKLELREFSSTANTAISAILKMYEDYEKGAAANPGKVPFYKCTGVTEVPSSYGTNYEPVFSFVAWVERKNIPAFDEHLGKAVQPASAGTMVAPNIPPNVADMPAARNDPILNDDIPF